MKIDPFALVIFLLLAAFFPPRACGQETKPAPLSTTSTDQDRKASSSARAEGWHFFRGDAASTGVARSELPSELDVVWEFKVRNGAFDGTAAIVTDPNDETKQIVLIGDLDGKLYALDLKTGAAIWEFTSEIGFGTAPLVHREKIFIGDLDGQFYCLNFKGEKVWSFQSEGEINSSANFFKDQVLFGSQDANLYALNMETGKLTWKYQSQDQIRCSITVVEDRAFVAGCDGFFHVVDLNNGTAFGKVEIHSPTGSTPAAQGSRVFFGTQAGAFFAIDAKKVQLDWVRQADRDGSDIVGGPAVNDQHVIFGTRSRMVHSLNPKDGKENWSATLKSKVDASPVIVGDRVYVPSTDGRLYALALKDGEVLWERQFNGGFIGSSAVAFGRLVIATNRGTVYCLGDKNQAESK